MQTIKHKKPLKINDFLLFFLYVIVLVIIENWYLEVYLQKKKNEKLILAIVYISICEMCMLC